MSAPTPAQVREYGVAAARACAALGIVREPERQAYRRRVVRELTGRASIKEVSTAEGYEAVMARLWADAGEFLRAADYSMAPERRLAYVVRVLACQLMQLKGGSEADAQAYIGGVLDQARIAHGRRDDGSWWMDVAAPQLLELVKILDTERRRILGRFTASAGRLSFTDRVRYEADGPLLVRQGVPKGYYSSAPCIGVNVRRGGRPCSS